MLQSKQILLELNAKLAETLTSKGVTATADETTTALVNKVADIASGDTIYFSNDGRMYTKNIILPEGLTVIGNWAFYKCVNLESVKIPYGVKKIGDHTFSYCESLTSINIPNSVTSIAGMAFEKCQNLKNITIPDSVINIGNYAFQFCINLTSITIPNRITNIGMFMFSDCKSLSSLVIPSSVMNINNSSFINCSKLEFVTLGDDFNADNLNLSASTLYSRETILQWLNALADRTGQTAYKLTIGAKNLAKLTEEDILIATNKNWTLA